MSHQDAVLLDDSLEETTLHPSELFGTMPELRQYLLPDRRDDEVGIRALLERPDALRTAWRRRAVTGARRYRSRNRFVRRAE